MPATDVDTKTSYRTLVNSFISLKIPFRETNDFKDLVVIIPGVVEFHFDALGNYLSFQVNNE